MRLHAVGLALLLFAGMAQAQDADLVLLNGKIVTLAARDDIQEALAIRDGKVLAVGRSDEMRRRAGPNATIVDLSGRTVIPGLIDSHMHAVRAGLFFGREVNWTGVKSIPEAMARIAAKARATPPGQWIVVGGGWTEEQFAEKRRPTQAELIAAVGDHPAYIQLFYRAVLLSPAGFEALRIASDQDMPPAGKLERDSNGTPTGWILGNNPTITLLFDKLPLPTAVQGLAGRQAHDPRALQSVRPAPEFGARRLQVGGPDAADAIWRRHAALQRDRRECDLGILQQRQHV